jgi:Fe-S-cluster containining protein
VERRSLQEFSANLNRGKSVMPDRRIELGFERTVCACPDCKRYCEYLPGVVIPSDLERLTEYLGYSSPVEFALENLLASPGATVIDGGQIRQVPSLVPARDQSGACLFLDEESRCRIHSVSPFGCGYFDHHQTNEEANRRSNAAYHQIDLAWKSNDLYARIWLLLKVMGRVAPPPTELRARMRAAIKSSATLSSP